MVLIEGLGDEVTLVLGSFLIIVILLLAWFSTHTNDIPLIREVGVIVVELRQRHRNRHQNRTEQPQEVEISQSSREGLLTPEPGDESGLVENSQAEESLNIQEEDGRNLGQVSDANVSPSESSSNSSAAGHSESSSISGNVLLSDEIKVTPAPSIDHPYSQQGTEQGGALFSSSNLHDFDSENVVDNSPVPGDSVVIPSHTSCLQETLEETLRRRRVEYFQSSGASSLLGDSVTNRVQGSDSGPFSSSRPESARSNVTGNKDFTDRTERDVLESVPCEGHQHKKNNASNSNLNEQLQDDLPESQREIRDSDHQDDHEEVVDDDNHSRIRVKLKYMNETQRFVYANPDDTIGDFRRTHFQTELQDNKWVRFIFNGQDLRDDARTLQACNIENNCTMHCLVTTRHQPGERLEVVMEDEEESMLGAMMYPLFAILLLIFWYFRIFYRQYFSAMSTVCLIGISFLLALSYVSSFRTTNDNTNNGNTNNQQQQPPPQAATGSSNGRQPHPHTD